VRAVRQPDAAKALEAASIDIVANTPEEFADYIKSETTKWARVVKASGAKVE
jgi:tripartite-type tricarboxylate transporter receptor subunit TctC